jgi:paraquat-inducible protein B
MHMAADRSGAVGAFVLGGLALGVGAILLFGGMSLFARNIRVVAYFPGSVAGLAVGAPVTFRGVQVGTVGNMRVHVALSDLKAVIPVYLNLDPSEITWTQGTLASGSVDFRRAVRDGLRAKLVSQSFVTGQVAVDLDFYPGPVEGPREPAGKDFEVPTVSSDIQHLKDELLQMNLPALAKQASQTLASIQHAADALSSESAPIVQSALQTSAEARVTLKAATVAIHGVQQDAARTLGSIDTLAVASRRQVVATGQNVDAVLAQANRLVAALSSAVSPGAPMRGDLEAALRDLAASAASIRQLTRHLERNPTGTLLTRSPP